MNNLSDFPKLGFGLGLRGPHVSHILEHKPAVDWFEIISENYMDNDGRGKRQLEAIKAHYPIVMHGVSLSIGTTDPVNSAYLTKLRTLADWVKPAWISDHLCWTGIAHKNTHDLLPVPYTEEALAHIIDRIKAVQDFMGRRIVLENPSTYLEFKSSTIPEEEFIARMAEAADCGLLLDVNNVYVSCYNHRKSTQSYIDALPLSRVVQIHLAGHTNNETHIVDTHDGPVIDEVWALYRYVISNAGMINTMVEWDDKIPPFDIVNAELVKARAAADTPHDHAPLADFKVDRPAYVANIATPLAAAQTHMQSAILSGHDEAPQNWIKDKDDFNPQKQLAVYIEGYRLRLIGVVKADYPVLLKYFGRDKMHVLLHDFVNSVPSHFYDAGKYPAGLPEFIKGDDFASQLALLESAISQLAFAPETIALTPADLEGITPDDLMAQAMPLRDALQLFEFHYNVNDYYSAAMNDAEIPAIIKASTYLAVFRHEEEMWRLPLDANEYALLQKMQSGTCVGDAIDTLDCDEDIITQNLPNWFARWMRNGLLAANTSTEERQAA